MVQALRNGTKTCTRRTQGLEEVNDEEGLGFNNIQLCYYIEIDTGKKIYSWQIGNTFLNKWIEVYPKANVGDVIWVRETFFDTTNVPQAELFRGVGKYIYKADNANIGFNKWKPSLFMPKKACRMWLEVTGVRVEKLQDISEEDAENEGIYDMFHGKDIAGNAYFNYMDKKGGWDSVADNAVHSFSTLWESINGKGSWDANPFVWVYDFKVMHERPEGFLNG
jgi:hypothetical protein